MQYISRPGLSNEQLLANKKRIVSAESISFKPRSILTTIAEEASTVRNYIVDALELKRTGMRLSHSVQGET